MPIGALTAKMGTTPALTASETGAPEIDPKRPYGNSDVELDVLEILGFTPAVPDGGWKAGDEVEYSEGQRKTADTIHRQMETALQIVLSTLSFVPGSYECQEYSDDWKLKAAF